MRAAAARTAAPDVSEVISDLRRRVEALESEVSALKVGRRLSRKDRHYLAAILPATAGVHGSSLLTASEIVEDDSPTMRLVRGDLNAKQLGRLFRRCEGVPIDGYLVQRDGMEAGAILWRVVKVLEFFERGNHSVTSHGAGLPTKLSAGGSSQ